MIHLMEKTFAFTKTHICLFLHLALLKMNVQVNDGIEIYQLTHAFRM